MYVPSWRAKFLHKEVSAPGPSLNCITGANVASGNRTGGYPLTLVKGRRATDKPSDTSVPILLPVHEGRHACWRLLGGWLGLRLRLRLRLGFGFGSRGLLGWSRRRRCLFTGPAEERQRLAARLGCWSRSRGGLGGVSTTATEASEKIDRCTWSCLLYRFLSLSGGPLLSSGSTLGLSSGSSGGLLLFRQSLLFLLLRGSSLGSSLALCFGCEI